jgi:transcriptional regulator with XRE-family HTH domain
VVPKAFHAYHSIKSNVEQGAQSMETSEITEWKALAATMRRTLAKNLSAALVVAGTTADSDGTTKLSLTDLNRQTDIARSTLSKLANGTTASGIQANPDLETLCRLASALNLPPAFLLMSDDDWQKLLGALNGLPQALTGSYLSDLISRSTHGDKVRVGLTLAEKLKLYPDNKKFVAEDKIHSEMRDEIDRDIERRNEIKHKAILTTTAILQGASKNRGDLSPLTAIGAIVGSNFSK